MLSTMGCSWFQRTQEVEIITKSIQLEILQPSLPREINLKEPHWYVVSDKNIDEFIERIRKETGGNVVFFAMSVPDYELMSYNMQEIKRYILEMKEIVVYYRKMTEIEEEVSE